MTELVSRLASVLVPVTLLALVLVGVGFDFTRAMETADWSSKNLDGLYGLAFPGDAAAEAATCGVFVVAVILFTIVAWSINEFRNKV